MHKSQHPYHPKFWHIWLLAFLFRLIAMLPIKMQLWLGKSVGRLLLRISKKRRKITNINLQMVFPHLTQIEIKQLTKKHFESLGMGIFETFMGWWSSDARLTNLYKVTGLENLHAATKQQRPIIIVGPHFTTIELVGRLFAKPHAIAITYRSHNNPALNHIYRTQRSRYYDQIIDKNDTRSLIKRLKAGKSVWLAPDQNFSGKARLFSPFFGVQAATMPVVSKLARLTNALVVPVSYPRETEKGTYLINFHPALENFPSTDAQADTDRINAILETFVRVAPEQYLWSHRRYKTRPDGEPPIY